MWYVFICEQGLYKNVESTFSLQFYIFMLHIIRVALKFSI